MSLQDTYDELKSVGSVVVAGSTSELKSLYVMLFRKHQSYCEQMEAIGFLGDNLRNTTVSARYAVDGTATYKLIAKRQPKQYTIIRTEEQNATETQSLRADMECDQSSAIRNGSTNPRTQDDAEDSDPLRTQGEDDGSSSNARHWGTY